MYFNANAAVKFLNPLHALSFEDLFVRSTTACEPLSMTHIIL